MNQDVTMSIYRKADGRIVGTLRHSGSASAESATKGQILGTFDRDTTYVDIAATPPVAKRRPISPIALDRTSISADGAGIATFSNIPASAEVSLDGGAYVAVPDGTLEFNATVPGAYAFTFRNFPDQDAKFTVTAA